MTGTRDPEHRFEGRPPLLWYTTRPPDLLVPGDRRVTRRRWLLDALACLALASLVFSEASREALYRPDFDFYSAVPLNAPTLRALVLNVLGVTAAGLAVVHVLRRARRLVWRRLGAVLAAATTIVALNAVRTTDPGLGGWTDALDVRLLVGVAVVVLTVSGAWPRHALRSVRGLAIVLSPLAVLTLVSTLWMFLEIARTVPWRRVAPAPPPLNATAPSLRRVVWVLLDDFDPRVAFEARPAGLALPELDRLRGHALYADAARLTTPTTDVSMPTLVTGRRVLSVAPVSADDLELRVAGDKPARWSAQPNVFSRARALGYNTALIGWRLPYARVFAGTVHAVHWWPSLAYDRTRAETFGAALTRQWASLALPVHVRRLYAERLAAVGDLALRTATDGRFGLVLLHLPIPALPGIYDPVNGRLTAWSFRGADAGYLDNVELVDRFVGELRRGLERGRLTDRTWVVLSSAQARAGSDGRVPFLVRAPDGDAAHADGAFDASVTQDLVISILRGSTADTDDVVRWLARVPAFRGK
jgi:hypothetical protein